MFQATKLLSGALGNELADAFNCLLTLGEETREEVPDMDHFGPNFEFDLDVCRFRAVRKTIGIVEQRLRITDLDQEWWKPFQIGIERCCERRAWIFALQVGLAIPTRPSR